MEEDLQITYIPQLVFGRVVPERAFCCGGERRSVDGEAGGVYVAPTCSVRHAFRSNLRCSFFAAQGSFVAFARSSMQRRHAKRGHVWRFLVVEEVLSFCIPWELSYAREHMRLALSRNVWRRDMEVLIMGMAHDPYLASQSTEDA